jgi:hypothetical protein
MQSTVTNTAQTYTPMSHLTNARTSKSTVVGFVQLWVDTGLSASKSQKGGQGGHLSNNMCRFGSGWTKEAARLAWRPILCNLKTLILPSLTWSFNNLLRWSLDEAQAWTSSKLQPIDIHNAHGFLVQPPQASNAKNLPANEGWSGQQTTQSRNHTVSNQNVK